MTKWLLVRVLGHRHVLAFFFISLSLTSKVLCAIISLDASLFASYLLNFYFDLWHLSYPQRYGWGRGTGLYGPHDAVAHSEEKSTLFFFHTFQPWRNREYAGKPVSRIVLFCVLVSIFMMIIISTGSFSCGILCCLSRECWLLKTHSLHCLLILQCAILDWILSIF